MNTQFEYHKLEALESLREIAKDGRIPFKIEKIDQLGYLLLVLINRAEDYDDKEERKGNAIYLLSVFLGEKIIKKTGGQWDEPVEETEYQITLTGGNIIYPFEKVEKFMTNGMSDSLFAYYKTITMLSKGK